MPVQAVISPDVVAWATGYVRTKVNVSGRPWYPNLFVGSTVPTVRRDWMVTIRRDGGPRVDVTQEVARLGVNCWAPTEAGLLNGTNGLAQLVRAYLLVAAGDGPVRGVTDISGPSIVPDESEQAHAYLTFEVVASGVDLT
jgi:hypothetical protein